MVAAADDPTPVNFYIDGQKAGGITVDKETLYLIHSGTNYGKHNLRIEAQKAGLRIYTLTFG